MHDAHDLCERVINAALAVVYPGRPASELQATKNAIEAKLATESAPIPSPLIGVDTPGEDDWDILATAAVNHPEPVKAAEAWRRLHDAALSSRLAEPKGD